MLLEAIAEQSNRSAAQGSLSPGGRLVILNLDDKILSRGYTTASEGGERQTVQDLAAETQETARLEQLLQATKGGDRAAFAELYQLTASRLLPIALRIMRRRDLAEDVLQEAYIAIWRKAASYNREAGQPLAWMATITRNRAIDRLRRDRKHADSHSDWDDGGKQEIEAQSQQLELPDHLSRSVRQCVEGLKENYRKAVLLAYYYGLTHEELATQLDCPLGTAKSWVRRGLSQLKDCMEQ